MYVLLETPTFIDAYDRDEKFAITNLPERFGKSVKNV